jgi:bifunctional non-homologous end joining protein LigD
MPALIEPCLATLVDAAPSGTRWLHEIKWDGYRLMAYLDRGVVVLRTRRGHDRTARFPTIAKAVARLPVTSAILDGEAVVDDEQGRPSFSALQVALGVREPRSHPGHKAAHEAVYYAFDLLWLDGEDLRGRALEERRSALEEILVDLEPGARLRLSEEVAGDGPTVLRHACAMGLEGIISKRRDCPYRSGRGRDWRKAKCTHRQELVIAGYLPRSDNARAVGAFVLGYYEAGALTYAGRVGTCFSATLAQTLWKAMQPLRGKAPELARKLPAAERKDVVWVRPELVAEVEFRGWTSPQSGNSTQVRESRGEPSTAAWASEIARSAAAAGPARAMRPWRNYSRWPGLRLRFVGCIASGRLSSSLMA